MFFLRLSQNFLHDFLRVRLGFLLRCGLGMVEHV